MIPAGYDSRLVHVLRERLSEAAAKKTAEVANGISRGDQFDYGKRCGQIQGLREAVDMIGEIETELMKEGRKD